MTRATGADEPAGASGRSRAPSGAPPGAPFGAPAKPTVDHLLYAGPDLPGLIAAVAASCGVEASPGGRHTKQGTHNALVGLGPSCYLELMAPDPDGVPDGDYRRSIAHLKAPQVFTWCARTANSAGLAARAAEIGLEVKVSEGGRRTPSGGELRWRLIVLVGHGFGGHLPFFIDWLDSPHPAAGLAPQGRLLALTLQHPDAVGLANLLRALAWPLGQATAPDQLVSVTPGDSAMISARLSVPAGEVELQGTGAGLQLTS